MAPQVKYYAACYRLLNCPDEKQEYVYVTDVDMIILHELPELMVFHLHEMGLHELCYSNTRRDKEPLGDKRVTGLHFASHEWYKKTEDLRRIYMHMLNNGEIARGRFDDELMLNHILVKSQMPAPNLKNLIKRHHGIHLGTVRAYINHSRERLNAELRRRISKTQAQQYVSFFKEAEFEKLVARAPHAIKNEIEIVYAFCMRLLNE